MPCHINIYICTVTDSKIKKRKKNIQSTTQNINRQTMLTQFDEMDTPLFINFGRQYCPKVTFTISFEVYIQSTSFKSYAF